MSLGLILMFTLITWSRGYLPCSSAEKTSESVEILKGGIKLSKLSLQIRINITAGLRDVY